MDIFSIQYSTEKTGKLRVGVQNVPSNTPEFLNKKHLNFGQGLEFLKFGQGNRGLNQQHQRKTKETIRTNEGKRGKSIRQFEVETLISYLIISYSIFLV